VAQVEVKIQRYANVVSFTPSPQTVTSLDILFWANTDEQQEHWPAPSAAQQTAWMPAAIPAKLKGQPPATSRGITFDPPSGGAPYNVSYVCALHPTETGVIKVTS
jgi:hypothetical protein